jgi:hypothetical protein
MEFGTMERYEVCTVEWYWMAPPSADPKNPFRPSFTVSFGGGRSESHEGSTGELTTFLGRLGGDGWRITSAVNSSNWILWTLERRSG